MNAGPRFVSLATMLFSLVLSTNSVGQSLPAELKAGFDSGVYSNLNALTAHNPFFGISYRKELRHWEYFDSQLNQQMFLVQYEIGGPSLFQFEEENSGSSGTESINQLLWMTARQQYVDGRDHRVTLYSVDPLPSSLLRENHMNLTSDALLAGTGYTGLKNVDNFFEANGSMQFYEQFHGCLASGCYYEATLNLVGLNYVRAANGRLVGSIEPFYNVADPQLFTLNRGFPGFGPDGADAFEETVSLVVAPLAVPEPSAFPVLAVMTLAIARRRK